MGALGIGIALLTKGSPSPDGRDAGAAFLLIHSGFSRRACQERSIKRSGGSLMILPELSSWKIAGSAWLLTKLLFDQGVLDPREHKGLNRNRMNMLNPVAVQMKGPWPLHLNAVAGRLWANT